MSENNIKQIRGQIRQIVKEILPDILNAELCNTIYKRLQQEMITQLSQVSDMVKKDLAKIDDQSKAVQDYLMRQVDSTPPTQPATSESVIPPAETL